VFTGSRRRERRLRAQLDTLAEVAADPEARAELQALLAPLIAPAATETPDDWLGVDDAAKHMGVKRQRVYDLKSAGLLPPDGYDGNRPKWRRRTLDAHLERGLR